MPLSQVPSAPEIRLHMAHPASGLWRLARRDEDGFGAPYWAYPWSGGLVLARYLLDHPHVAAGRRVLDLGAGSGLVGIAAAKAGARDVLAAEVDPYAAQALALNAAANQVQLQIVMEDLTGGAPPDVDLALIGDLYYERALAGRVTAFLDRCLASGVEVLIGDPGRAFLPRERLARLKDYPIPDFGGAGPSEAGASSVFRLEPRPRRP
jgi:predicted nicotinamide N-methyase